MATKKEKAPAADRGARADVDKGDKTDRAERERASAKGTAWRGNRSGEPAEE